MRISKISLKSHGSKGAKIEWTEDQKKDGYDWKVPTSKSPRYPIHLGLEKKINELRVFALEFSGYFKGSSDKGVKAFIKQDCQITEIIFVKDGFKFKFELENCGKTIKVETFDILKQDGFESFNEINEILDAVKEETELYLQGKVVVSDKEMVTMFAKNNKQITLEFIEGLDETELKEFCTKTLTKMGSVVAHVDLDEEESDVINDVEFEERPYEELEPEPVLRKAN